MAYQSINPFDNHLEKSFDEISDAQLEAKLTAAASCFVTWKRTSYAHRAKSSPAPPSCCMSKPNASPRS